MWGTHKALLFRLLHSPLLVQLFLLRSFDSSQVALCQHFNTRQSNQFVGSALNPSKAKL